MQISYQKQNLQCNATINAQFWYHTRENRSLTMGGEKNLYGTWPRQNVKNINLTNNLVNAFFILFKTYLFSALVYYILKWRCNGDALHGKINFGLKMSSTKVTLSYSQCIFSVLLRWDNAIKVWGYAIKMLV